MALVEIREYREGDGPAVRELFTLGMSEHVPTSFVHVLKQPLSQMLLVCTFCALMASSKSFLLPILAVTLLLAAARQLLVHKFNGYIDACCGADLAHIGDTYMSPPDACFWVAECEGRLVGTVSCLPNPSYPDCLELKRMSVRRGYRRTGVAKKLCRTVAEFTRARGYAGVVLVTSVVQTDAQKLYEGLGYSKVREFVEADIAAKLMNFSLFEYRLDLVQK
ncbi:probable N-acetyltransferase camello isoform X2 [Corythoichthys intestinalis]|nr:probable N-acetyltransferase camello isoform X2 [Corythoichthys intestinalis]XP_057716435.1 probable N-acetyltransferase camello isoform X2 [Corythoichthys intestinalis]XP_061798090.1 probable N-acetyltransferase camello [Nerophis lumbriciformis]